jgi:hypothetical protein
MAGTEPGFLRLLHTRLPLGHVRYGSLADIRVRIWDVRFTPKSGHVQHLHCLLCAKSGRAF